MTKYNVGDRVLVVGYEALSPFGINRWASESGMRSFMGMEVTIKNVFLNGVNPFGYDENLVNYYEIEERIPGYEFAPRLYPEMVEALCPVVEDEVGPFPDMSRDLFELLSRR